MSLTKSFFIALCLLLVDGTGLMAQPVEPLSEKEFTLAQLQQDFKALRHRYESSLANLYLYNTKPQMDHLFDSLYLHLSPMTERAFFNYIAPLQSVVKDGHSLILPAAQTARYHVGHSRYFPFQVYIDSGRLFTIRNFSNDTSIKDGSEILSINGQSSAEVLDFLMVRLARDGYNQTFPRWILNNYFRGYYNMSFGYPETYRLKLKTLDSQTIDVQVNGTTQDTIALYKKQRYGQPTVTSLAGKGIYLETKGSIAILTIKTWDAKWLRTIYHQQFRKEIDAVFHQLQQNNTSHLIIDLRDNQGGSTEFGDYLLSYLLQQPYQYTTGLYKVAGNNDSAHILKSCKAAFLRVHHPRQNNYQGKLYVLINGGSFSNSGIFSSAIERYKRGVFIGEETGGNKTVLTGVFGLGNKTILPNTKIECDRSNYRMVITDLKNNTGHGVMPAYSLSPTVDQMINKTDIVLNKALLLTEQTK